MKKPLIVLSLIISLGLIDSGFCLEEDNQVWSMVSAEKRIGAHWGVRFEEESRFGDDANKLISQHLDVGLVYFHNDFLQTSLNYRYIIADKNLTKREEEHRPHFNLTLLKQWEKFHFANRSRIEYRMLDKTRDGWRYRNKTKIELPVEWMSFNFSPFVGYEYFIDFDQGTFNFSRLSGGVELLITEAITAELYYLRQDSPDRTFSFKRDVVGIGFNFVF